MLKFLLVILLLAVAVYLTVRLAESRASGAPLRPKRPRREPPRIVAPDDDPEFLRELERRRRQRDEPESPA